MGLINNNSPPNLSPEDSPLSESPPSHTQISGYGIHAKPLSDVSTPETGKANAIGIKVIDEMTRSTAIAKALKLANSDMSIGLTSSSDGGLEYDLYSIHSDNVAKSSINDGDEVASDDDTEIDAEEDQAVEDDETGRSYAFSGDPEDIGSQQASPQIEPINFKYIQHASPTERITYCREFLNPYTADLLSALALRDSSARAAAEAQEAWETTDFPESDASSVDAALSQTVQEELENKALIASAIAKAADKAYVDLVTRSEAVGSEAAELLAKNFGKLGLETASLDERLNLCIQIASKGPTAALALAKNYRDLGLSNANADEHYSLLLVMWDVNAKPAIDTYVHQMPFARKSISLGRSFGIKVKKTKTDGEAPSENKEEPMPSKIDLKVGVIASDYFAHRAQYRRTFFLSFLKHL